MRRGTRYAHSIVTSTYPDATLEPYPDAQTSVGFIIKNNPTGTVLSPICAGEGSAWRFAALLLLVSSKLSDEILEIDEEVPSGTALKK